MLDLAEIVEGFVLEHNSQFVPMNSDWFDFELPNCFDQALPKHYYCLHCFAFPKNLQQYWLFPMHYWCLELDQVLPIHFYLYLCQCWELPKDYCQPSWDWYYQSPPMYQCFGLNLCLCSVFPKHCFDWFHWMCPNRFLDQYSELPKCCQYWLQLYSECLCQNQSKAWHWGSRPTLQHSHPNYSSLPMSSGRWLKYYLNQILLAP